MKFVIEHSVSTNLAAAIAILAELDGDEVAHLRTQYSQDTLDPVWLRGLGEREPQTVVISADIWQQAAKLVRWWPDIAKEAKRAKKGTGFLVSIQGKIERLKR